MQLEQVDTVQLHAAQAHLCFLAQILRPADRRPRARAGAGDRAEAREPRLRRDHEALRVRVQRLPDQFFSDIRSVGVGGVDEIHPELDRAPEHADRLVVIARWAPNARSGELHRPVTRRLIVRSPPRPNVPARWAGRSSAVISFVPSVGGTGSALTHLAAFLVLWPTSTGSIGWQA